MYVPRRFYVRALVDPVRNFPCGVVSQGWSRVGFHVAVGRGFTTPRVLAGERVLRVLPGIPLVLFPPMARFLMCAWLSFHG